MNPTKNTEDLITWANAGRPCIAPPIVGLPQRLDGDSFGWPGPNGWIASLDPSGITWRLKWRDTGIALRLTFSGEHESVLPGDNGFPPISTGWFIPLDVLQTFIPGEDTMLYPDDMSPENSTPGRRKTQRI